MLQLLVSPPDPERATSYPPAAGTHIVTLTLAKAASLRGDSSAMAAPLCLAAAVAHAALGVLAGQPLVEPDGPAAPDAPVQLVTCEGATAAHKGCGIRGMDTTVACTTVRCDCTC